MMDADPCSTDTNASYVVHFHGHLVNLTSEDTQNRCESGYSAGWNLTCAQALENPHIDHGDIGSCPGFTDKQIQEIQSHDSVPKQTAQEKAECAVMNHIARKFDKARGIAEPKGGLPCTA